MKNTTLYIAIGLSLAACGGGSTLGNAPIDRGSSGDTLEIGAATDATTDPTIETTTGPDVAETSTSNEVVPEVVTDSQSLNVSNTFKFNTARTVEIDFDLDQARNQSASVSICTSFDPSGGVFDVDYDSCTVQGQMVNGIFNHSMDVTNDIDSVAAVVWFEDSSMLPIMQVFSVAHSSSGSTGRSEKDRSVLSLSRPPRIVWR